MTFAANAFPSIDMVRTGRRIEAIRKSRGYSVKDLQEYFGFEYPQAVYKWQHGECLPSVDNLLALSRLLRVGMEDLLVTRGSEDREVPSFYETRETSTGKMGAAKLRTLFSVFGSRRLMSMERGRGPAECELGSTAGAQSAELCVFHCRGNSGTAPVELFLNSVMPVSRNGEAAFPFYLKQRGKRMKIP